MQDIQLVIRIDFNWRVESLVVVFIQYKEEAAQPSKIKCPFHGYWTYDFFLLFI